MFLVSSNQTDCEPGSIWHFLETLESKTLKGKQTFYFEFHLSYLLAFYTSRDAPDGVASLYRSAL
jgi:hypothetical protein